VKEGLEFALNVFRMSEQDVVKWLCEQSARFAELKEWLPSDHPHFCVEKCVLEGTSWREVDVKLAMKGITALHFRNCVGFVKNLSVKGVVQSLGCVATFLTEEKLTAEQQKDFVAQTCKLISHLFAWKVGSVAPTESDAFPMGVTHAGWKETLRTCLRPHLARRQKGGQAPPEFINELAEQLFTAEEMPKPNLRNKKKVRTQRRCSLTIASSLSTTWSCFRQEKRRQSGMVNVPLFGS